MPSQRERLSALSANICPRRSSTVRRQTKIPAEASSIMLSIPKATSSRPSFEKCGALENVTERNACNAADVDITAHSCKLTFGAKTANLTGDKAHELYATMAEVGVPSEGSAGAVHESLSHLVCTINPHEIAQKSGSGADCVFDAQASLAAKSDP
jgi:hypothetical protein